ncbi:NACHT, LRR and PYD domains-containing protein 6-like [Lithobates pipiens]
MATSSSSSQGWSPDIPGKVPQTPGDLIVDSLEDLKGSDFKTFRNKLSDFSYGDKRPIPRGRLEHADWITTKDFLIEAYGEEGALDVTIQVFTLIDLMDPANDLRERRAKYGSAPDIPGKVPQTSGDLIIYSLEDLKGSDFKKFRNKLSDFSYGDKRPIPRGRLENADWITTKDFLIEAYGEEGALDVTIQVFTLIDLMDPANDLRERRAKYGLAPNISGRKKQTSGDLIVYALEDLNRSDFKRFRNKLSDFSYGDKRPVPRGRLEHAECITTKDLLIEAYGEEGALDVTIQVFTLIDLTGPANNLWERRALCDIGKEHRESMKQKLQRIPEYNSRMGEAVYLQERFTELLMTVGPQNKEGKEQELRSSGRRHLQIMEKRPPTTIQTLFDPDQYGFTPRVVVLEGPAGIGKTMTSKKIMLDWASGDLYRDKFDFVFYLSCREISTIPGKISLVGLLSRTCRLSSDDLVLILRDPGSRRKLLTIVDGFDEMRWTLEEKSEGCPDISMETHQEIILQSLLRGRVLPESSLIITTRSLAIETLNTFIDDSRNVEIQGFTRADREKYVHRFYGNKEDADKVLSVIKDNDVVYTMCAVPITCWIVCTVIKKEIRKGLDVIWCPTTTYIYLLYLEVLLTHHSKKDLSVHQKQTCLKKLCALANQGVLNQQILFVKKDLERHGLSLDEVESLFLNENIFRLDLHTQICYSFIHLSVQEFLAALYYGMDDESMEGTFLPEICKGESLVDFTISQYPHLALAVQFLYGLLNENQMKMFSEITGIDVSLRAKPAMIEWSKKDNNGSFSIHAIVCLYETQDEDVIRRILSGCSHLRVYGSLSDDLQRDSNSKQLRYCLKTLKRERFQDLCFEWLTLDPKSQKYIYSFLHRCQTVRLIGCGLTSSCCNDLRSILINNQSLITLDLSDNNLQDSGIKLLCEGLQDPGCTLQDLRLRNVSLTDECAPCLVSLSNNRTLTALDLRSNHLTDASAEHLQDLILTSTILKEIRIGGNEFSSNVEQIVEEILADIQRSELCLAKSGCGNQEEALMEFQEEPENLVTPIVDGKTYRLKLKPGRLFRCSETGIMFKAKSESIVTYELEFGSENLNEVQNKGYDIVGPVFNITVEPGILSVVHLPHYLSLEDLKRGFVLIRCGHVTGGKFNITKPVTVGSSHIVIENPSSSNFFPALHAKLWRRPIPLEGKVLLYSKVVSPEDVNYMEYTFHLYVVPVNQPQLRKLDKEKRDDGFNHMNKPHQIQRSLNFKTDYAFSVQPNGALLPEVKLYIFLPKT